ncbi:unnamed protein product [Brassica oleracea]
MRQRKPSTTIFQEIFDANADGKISAAELEEALNKLGSVTHDDVNRMMTEIDTDELEALARTCVSSDPSK